MGVERRLRPERRAISMGINPQGLCRGDGDRKMSTVVAVFEDELAEQGLLSQKLASTMRGFLLSPSTESVSTKSRGPRFFPSLSPASSIPAISKRLVTLMDWYASGV